MANSERAGYVTVTEGEMTKLIEASTRDHPLDCLWCSPRIPTSPENQWALDLLEEWRG